MSDLFSYVPSDDERATLTVTAGDGRCAICCTWSYEAVSVDLPPDRAPSWEQVVIGRANAR